MKSCLYKEALIVTGEIPNVNETILGQEVGESMGSLRQESLVPADL